MKNNNRKQEIIESCIHLICEKGLELSSMQSIANEVGLSKATLYFYFDSKETLFREVYEYCHQLDVEACNKGISEIASPLEKLCKRFSNIIEHTIKHPKEAQVEVLYATSFNYKNANMADREDFLHDIAEIMREGIEKNEIKPTAVWLLSELYYGMTMAMYMKFRNNPDLWNEEAIRDSCYQIIRDSFSVNDKK